MMVTRRGLKKDTLFQRLIYRPAYRLLGATPPLDYGLVSLAEYAGPLFDQGGQGSCNGHRTSAALTTAFNAMGTPLPFEPSPRELYADARLFERRPDAAHNLPPLVDWGSSTGDMVTTVTTLGVKAMGPQVEGRFSDCGAANVNDEPTITALSAQSRNRLLVDPGAYEIDLNDTANALAVLQQALAHKYPVALDIDCDTIFEDYAGGNPIDDYNAADPNQGGHAILCTEMYIGTAGNITLAGPNSWGTWGASALQAGTNQHTGYWRATANWFSKAVFSALVFKCSRV